jgi:hypothetical protein
MGLSDFQREVCRLLAGNRLRSGESYVAGGAALNEVLHARRRSRDIDLFHDTEEALAASWQADRSSLEGTGYTVSVFRERPGWVAAEVAAGGDQVLLQWSRDSAYRFFPLVRHDDLGLVLHPFDLATSKVLALVGRVEPRDFVDVLTCDDSVQPFGYLAWAASGKDPGFSPASILEEAARANRYSAEELAGLDFEGPPPDAGELSRRWHRALAAARTIVAALPAEEAGRAVLLADGALFAGDASSLRAALEAGRVVFHRGAIRGALPRIVLRRP